jgi:phosphotriesterase-related protein
MPERVEGSILVHEHVLVDFGGAWLADPSRYDVNEVVRAARPRIEEVKAFGCVRILECTPRHMGRNPRLLARLQGESGVELWTNTGIYGAASRKGVPDYAYWESAAQLAARFAAEYRDGIDGVRPRFIKTAVNGFPLEDVDRKLIEAAALASRETGLAIASHTNGGGRAAEAQLAILDKLNCPAARFIWVHAQSEKDQRWHEKIARAGAWVEFDGVSERSAAWHRDCVLRLRAAGLLNRALVSHDAGWYHVGETGGGVYRGYTELYTHFLPLVPPEIHRTLLVDNPRAAFGA